MPEIELKLEDMSSELKHRIAFRSWLIGLIMGAALCWFYKPQYQEPVRASEVWTTDGNWWREYVYCMRFINGRPDDANSGWVKRGERCL